MPFFYVTAFFYLIPFFAPFFAWKPALSTSCREDRRPDGIGWLRILIVSPRGPVTMTAK